MEGIHPNCMSTFTAGPPLARGALVPFSTV